MYRPRFRSANLRRATRIVSHQSLFHTNQSRNFLPDAGRLLHTRPPVHAPHRLETGFTEGDEISSYYDPMVGFIHTYRMKLIVQISKLIVHGKDRSEALTMLQRALGEYQVVGPSTNIEFLKAVAGHPEFAKGEVETSFIPVNTRLCRVEDPAKTGRNIMMTCLPVMQHRLKCLRKVRYS